MAKRKNLFIVWNPFQRRSESLARDFDLDTQYIWYEWDQRGKLYRALSYLPKFMSTIRILFRHKPKYVFIQLAPTPLLYAAALYKLFTGNQYIADCHNTMIYDDHWIKWPLARRLLCWSCVTLTHNDDVQQLAERLGISSLVLRDPLPVMSVPDSIEVVAGISIKQTTYIMVPSGMAAADEPVEEFFEAARTMPDVLFAVTWFKEKLPARLLGAAPENICFTGFLDETEFNALYAHAGAALVLTTREGTQPSGAAEAIALGVPLVLSEI